MTLAQLIKLRTNDGLDIVDFLLEVMQDRYSDFRICHRLQAAKLLNTYGNEDSPNFIDDNPREPRSDRNGRRPSRPTKFDTELARVIREDTNDGRSIVRFLVNAMVGEFRSFRPHHRMAAARELLDRGFGKSARTHQTVHPEPVEGPTPTNRHSRERTACPALDAGSPRTPIRGRNPENISLSTNPTHLTPHSSPLTLGQPARTHQTVHPEPVEGHPAPNRRSGEGTSPRTPIRGRNPENISLSTNPTHLTPHSSPLTPGQPTRTHQTVHPEPVEGPTPTNRHSRERTACPALDAGSLRTPIRGGNPRSGSPLGNPGAGEALTPHSSPLTPGESTDLLDDIDCGRCHCLIDIDDIDATPDTPNHPRKLDKNHHTHHT